MNYNSSAQTIDASVSLIDELKRLENKFGITFSYLDENIQGITVDPVSNEQSLHESLQWLESQTSLKFHQIDEQFYAISQRIEVATKFCAYLKDADTKEPVSQAFVIADTVRVVSNELGYFEILGSVSQNLEIIHIGYNSSILEIEKASTTDCEILLLEPKIATLEEVTVFNYMAKGIEKNANGEYTIHSPQLQVLPGLIDADAFQSLQFLPGIFSAAESVSDINVRGGTNDQNLMLWDGVRIYQTGHFFGLISIFNPYFVDQVTLAKNGTTARLGEAVSGTIAVDTDDEVPENLSISGGFNLLNADMVVSIPVSQRTSVSMSVRRSISSLLQTPTYDKYFDRAFGAIESSINAQADSLVGEVQNFDYYDIGLKINTHVSDGDEISFSLLNASDDLTYQESIVSSAIQTKSSAINKQSTATGFAYRKLWTEKVNTLLSGHLTKYQLSAQNSDIVNNQRLEQENTVLDWGVKLDLQASFSDKIRLSTGYHFDEIGATNQDEIDNPNFSRKIKEVLHSHVLYVESNLLSDSKKTSLAAGLRTNYYQQLDRFYLEPRLTLNYKLTEKWSVDLVGEYKSQTTIQIIDLQNDFLGVEKRRWVLANNDDIPIVRSKQASVGIQYAYNKILMSLEGYQKYVDGIVTSSQSFQNQFELIRSPGAYEVTGMDALINVTFDNLSTWVSYTLSRNYSEFKELLTEKFPSNIDIRHFVSSGINYSSKRFECSVGFNLHTGAPYTAPEEAMPVVNGVINYQFPNSSNLSDYFRLDWSAKYKFDLGKKAKGLLGFSLWNITNQDNEVNAYYLLDEDDHPVQIIESGLGFTPNVSARITF
ncbi:TonB-dependent receptor [Reichenbachiella sp.]